MPTQSAFYSRIFSLVVAAVLGYALWRIFAPFFNAMSWAAFLAFLLYPLNLRFRRHLHGKGRAAGTREMVVRPNYLVVYAVDEQTVRILRVLHVAQQWPT